jgi:L-ascorbate metabolism protein UlaG (beta-lactamase superfamily)
MIYNDPTNGAAAYASFPRADLILVSHAHTDHFSSSTIDAVRGPTAVIIVPQAVYNSLSTAQKAIAIVLTNGASTNVMGLMVEAVPSYNFATNQTIYHPKGTGNGYVLTIGGRRIYASGDTEDVPEIRALPNIDVAFLCINRPFTMPVDRAASAVRDFRPKVIYPYHYRNQDGTFSDLADFKRRVGQDLGIEVRLRKWY